MDNRILCPVCESEKGFVEVERVAEFNILRCSACDLEFSKPMINPGEHWYDSAYIIRHSALDARVRDYYKWAVASIPNRGTLLDIGCGEGVFVNYSSKKGFNSYGIDFSKEAIQMGKRRYGLTTLFYGSLSKFKETFKIREFDTITFFEVLEHLDKPKEFLEEVKTLLKEGGYVALSVPYRDRWPIREFNDYPPHHLTRWTEKSLITFFQKNGFEIIKVNIGSGLRSYGIFLAYLFRLLIYGICRMHQKGINTKTMEDANKIKRLLTNPFVKRILSSMKPREIRDIIVWPFAVITYPFFFQWFKGYNIMLLARRKA